MCNVKFFCQEFSIYFFMLCAMFVNLDSENILKSPYRNRLDWRFIPKFKMRRNDK